MKCEKTAAIRYQSIAENPSLFPYLFTNVENYQFIKDFFNH